MDNELLIQCIFEVLQVTNPRKQADIMHKARALEQAIRERYSVDQLEQIADVEKRRQD